MTRGRGRIRRAAVAVVGVVGALVLGAGPAWADVQVFADHPRPGAENVTLTFRATNVGNSATTRLQVLLPTDTPLLGVTAGTQDGWTPSLASTTLSVPVQSASGPVTTAVSSITWTGGTITGTASEDFTVYVAKLPEGVGSLMFQVLQTDDADRTVAWFDTVVPGGPPPAHPAPVLSLGGSAQQAPPTTAPPQHHHDAVAGPDVAPPAGPRPTTAAIAWTLGAAGLGMAVVAATAVLLGRRQRRRFNALNDETVPAERSG